MYSSLKIENDRNSAAPTKCVILVYRHDNIKRFYGNIIENTHVPYVEERSIITPEICHPLDYLNLVCGEYYKPMQFSDITEWEISIDFLVNV